MARDRAEPTPPEGLPDEVASDLHRMDSEELRKAIIHAQELLNFNEENPSPVEPKPGDDILRIIEHEGYTEVVKYVYGNEDGETVRYGPYHYHVYEARYPDGSIKPYWRFLGETVLDE